MNSDKREKIINNFISLFRISAFGVHSFIYYLCVAAGILSIVWVQPALSDNNLSAPVQLHASDSIAKAGYFQLNWELPGEQESNGASAIFDSEQTFIVQQAKDSSFTDVTQWSVSRENSFSMSGLETGKYFYRVGAFDSANLSKSKPRAWSNVVEVQVLHHSLPRAFGIFSLGAVLFAALMTVIFINRNPQANG